MKSALLLGALGAAMATAGAAPLEWDASVGVVHRNLRESDAAGRRLVLESGPLAEARVTATTGPFSLRGRLAGGRLAYAGQTQAGSLLATRSQHREAELAARWRAADFGPWGTVSAELSQLWFERTIVSTPTVGGLVETSTLTLPGIAWQSATFGAWNWRADARWRASVRHRLSVDFHGLYDDTGITSGRRRELGLVLSAEPAPAWRVGLEWTRARQPTSSAGALTRGGALVGSLREPRIAIDDIALTATRTF